MARILLVSYHFPPSTAVGAQRPARIARAALERGHELRVICGPANGNGSGPVPPANVERVAAPFVLGRDPAPPSPSASRPAWAWWKARLYAETLVLTRDWEWRWGERVVELLRSGDADVDGVILDGPPFRAVAPVALHCRERDVPYLLDLRDLWVAPDAHPGPFAALHPTRRRDLWEREIRSQVLRGAAAIVLTTDEIRDAVHRSDPGLDAEVLHTVTNAYTDVDEEPQVASTTDSPGPLLVYAGSLAYGRDAQLRQVLEALARESGPRPPWRLVVAGDDGRALAGLVETLGLDDRVTFLGWLDRHEALELQRQASALLLLQPDTHDWTRHAIPAKLFDYMARRKPILALVPEGGPAARIVQDHGLGEVTPAAALADEMEGTLESLRVRADMGAFLCPPPAEFSDGVTMDRFWTKTEGSVL